MLDKPLKDIDISDIEKLKLDQVREGKTIDYKRDMYLLDHDNQEVRDKQREEFLKDVSSFANTIGGHLIIGIEEDNLVPVGISGITINDLDKLKNQLHQLIDRWIEPRISCDIEGAQLSGVPNKYVLLIRVSQSLVAPHRIVYQGQFGQFYGRNSSGTFIMDTSNLRQAFTLSETVYDRIKAFHKDRINQIINHDAPVLTKGDSHLILHLIPLESFSAHTIFDVETIRSAKVSHSRLFYNGRYNMDGYVSFEGHDEATGKNRSYIQLFRNGGVEYVQSDIVHPLSNNPSILRQYGITAEDAKSHSYLFTDCLEQEAVDYMKCHFQFFNNLGIHPPIWCFVTLSNVKDALIWYRDALRTTDQSRPIDREILDLPELRIDDFSVDPQVLLKPLIDIMWNAGGWKESPNVVV